MHDKFSLCFNSSLNYCRNLNFLNYIGRMFHKSLPLKFDEFIPYFWVFTFRIEREVPLLREYGIFFYLHVFHLNLGQSLYLDLYISMARNCKCLWWIFSLLLKAKRSSYVPMSLLYTTCKVSYLLYLINSLNIYFKQNIQINGQYWISITEQAKILTFSYVRNFLSLLRAYSS